MPSFGGVGRAGLLKQRCRVLGRNSDESLRKGNFFLVFLCGLLVCGVLRVGDFHCAPSELHRGAKHWGDHT